MVNKEKNRIVATRKDLAAFFVAPVLSRVKRLIPAGAALFYGVSNG